MRGLAALFLVALALRPQILAIGPLLRWLLVAIAAAMLPISLSLGEGRLRRAAAGPQ